MLSNNFTFYNVTWKDLDDNWWDSGYCTYDVACFLFKQKFSMKDVNAVVIYCQDKIVVKWPCNLKLEEM